MLVKATRVRSSVLRFGVAGRTRPVARATLKTWLIHANVRCAAGR
jgi:hypothetical protein